jgi:hypothetical protein
METMDTQSLAIAAVVILALVAIAVWLWNQKQQSRRLEQRFGPEYKRAVDQFGSRPKAEAELKTREKRVEKLDIVPLAPADAERFRQDWKVLQGRFVDNPKDVLADADLLVRELMQKRGYPMGDFDSRAADISVDHPGVVDHYRAAHDIALRNRHGDVDTEGMRQAVIHLRALFAELLEIEEPQPVRGQPQKHMETQS